MHGNSAYVGLRSGGVLVVEKLKNGGVRVDAFQVKLTDVAHGLANQRRFAGHLYRPYTVAEHSVLGSHLVPEHLALQFLFHDADEGFGLGDMNGKLKHLFATCTKPVSDAITEALCEKFDVPYPFDPEVKRVDKMLGDYEALVMHPAHPKMFAGYGVSADAIRSTPPKDMLDKMQNWFSRPPVKDEDLANLWLVRFNEMILTAERRRRVSEGFKKFLGAKDFFPYPEKLLVERIAGEIHVHSRYVADEVARLLKAGELVIRGGFFYLPDKRTDDGSDPAQPDPGPSSEQVSQAGGGGHPATEGSEGTTDR